MVQPAFDTAHGTAACTLFTALHGADMSSLLWLPSLETLRSAYIACTDLPKVFCSLLVVQLPGNRQVLFIVLST